MRKLEGIHVSQTNFKIILQLIFSIKKDNEFSYKSALARNWYLIYTIWNIISYKGFLGEHLNELLSMSQYISSSQIDFTKKNEKLMDRLFTLLPTHLLKKFINLSKIPFLIEINSEFPFLFYEYTPTIYELNNCSTLLQAFFPHKIIPSVFFIIYTILMNLKRRFFSM